MTPVPDQRIREHFDAARRAELSPGSFDRLTDRLDAPLAPPSRRSPRVLALAAVLLLVVGAAVVVATTRGDDGEDVRSTDDPSSTTAPRTTTERDPTTTTPTVPSGDERPETIAAVVDPDGDGSGALVVLDGSTGEVLRTLREDGAVDVDVAPDGTIYFQSSSPPGDEYGSSIVAVDPVTGARGTSYPRSHRPAISSDGVRLARGEPGTVRSGTIPSGPAEILVGLEVGPDRGGSNHHLGDLAWSRDGRLVAVERVDQRIYASRQPPVSSVFVLDTTKSLDSPGSHIDVAVEGAASPVFPADGSLLVVAGATGPASGTTVTGDRIVAWDLDRGQVTGEVSVPHVSGLDASANGAWVIATRAGRVPHVVMRPGAVGDLGPLPQAPEGIIAAAW